jgi:transcriptional regulator with XRE-family HTH domain
VTTAAGLISQARGRSNLSQEELAKRAGTSRTAVSAYESGSKDPRSETVERLLEASGHRLTLARVLTWVTLGSGRKTFSVPSSLPVLEPSQALASVQLPHHVAWSGQGSFNLAAPRERARAYEVLLAEGLPEDIERHVDGALLVNIWDDLFLPRHVKTAWQPLIDSVRNG